jgi:hypothetical protein
MAFEFQIHLSFSPLAVALLTVRSPFFFLQIPTPQAPFVFDTSALQPLRDTPCREISVEGNQELYASF